MAIIKRGSAVATASLKETANDFGQKEEGNGNNLPAVPQKIEMSDESLKGPDETKMIKLMDCRSGFTLPGNKLESSPLKANGSKDGVDIPLRSSKTTWMTTVPEPKAISMNGGKEQSGQMLLSGEPDGRRRRRSPKIEVCQKDFKTVVKISIKDLPSPNPDEISFDDLRSNEKKFHENRDNIDTASEVVYENVSFSEGENDLRSKSGQCDYQNVFPGDCLYANFSGDVSRANESEFQRMISAELKKNLERVDDDATYENVENTCPVYTNESFHKNQGNFSVVSKETGEFKKEASEEVSDSGTSSDVDSLLSAFVRAQKGPIVVTIKSFQNQEPKKEEGGHGRAESLTSSGVGVDSEESDDEKSNISCDSLNGSDPYTQSNCEDHGYHTPNLEDATGSPVDAIVYEVLKADGTTEKETPISEPEAKTEENFGDKDVEPSDFHSGYEALEREYFQRKKKPAPPPPPPPQKNPENSLETVDDQKPLPKNLLRDIESRHVRLSSTYPNGESKTNGKTSVAQVIFHMESAKEPETNKSSKNVPNFEQKTYEEQIKNNKKCVKVKEICAMEVDTDRFYKFHISENFREENGEDDETFAGIKDYLSREKSSAITSAKGTIRGVKNRVKAGIATFLQMQENKSYKDKDAGKVVVYTTTMGIVRETYHKCLKVKQILKTLMVKFEERDVFMSAEAQEEIRTRMRCNVILVPQVFVEGQHIGDAETIERLNEMGELRAILKAYKSPDACSTCKVCGGYRLLPCSVCKGSKKSIHRNHFTAEFVSLKCMNCDQVGLVKCHAC